MLDIITLGLFLCNILNFFSLKPLLHVLNALKSKHIVLKGLISQPTLETQENGHTWLKLAVPLWQRSLRQKSKLKISYF